MTVNRFDLGDCLHLSPTDPARFAGASEAERRTTLRRLTDLVRAEGDAGVLQEIVAYGALHPEPMVRLAILQGLARPDDHADFVAWCLLDPDDAVVEACLEVIARDAISGPAVLRSLLDRVGRDPAVAAAVAERGATGIEQRLARRCLDLLSEPWAADVVAELPAPTAGVDLDSRTATDGMVFVDAEFLRAAGAGSGGTGVCLDAHLVTRAEYETFLTAIEHSGHLHCHADEPRRKDHRPSLALEERAAGGLEPVTGVDWYDAYAFAGWAGKRLPSEVELEAADLSAPAGEGPLWQWTDRRYVDGRALAPRHGTREAYEVLGDWSAEVALRGSGLAAAASPAGGAVRAQASLYRRSPEIGFRCALTPAEGAR